MYTVTTIFLGGQREPVICNCDTLDNAAWEHERLVSFYEVTTVPVRIVIASVLSSTTVTRKAPTYAYR